MNRFGKRLLAVFLCSALLADSSQALSISTFLSSRPQTVQTGNVFQASFNESAVIVRVLGWLPGGNTFRAKLVQKFPTTSRPSIARTTTPKVTNNPGHPGRALQLTGKLGIDLQNALALLKSGRLYYGLFPRQIASLMQAEAGGNPHWSHQRLEIPAGFWAFKDLPKSDRFALHYNKERDHFVVTKEETVVDFIHFRWESGGYRTEFRDRSGRPMTFVSAITEVRATILRKMLTELRDKLGSWLTVPDDVFVEIRHYGHDYAAEEDQGTIILDTDEFKSHAGLSRDFVRELYHQSHPDLSDAQAEARVFLHEGVQYGFDLALQTVKDMGLGPLADRLRRFLKDSLGGLEVARASAPSLLSEQLEPEQKTKLDKLYGLWERTLSKLPRRTMRSETADFRESGPETEVQRKTTPQAVTPGSTEVQTPEPTDEERQQMVWTAYNNHFKTDPEGIFKAPGRNTLFGDHQDYHFLFPARTIAWASQRNVIVAAGKHPDPHKKTVELVSLDLKETYEFDADQLDRLADEARRKPADSEITDLDGRPVPAWALSFIALLYSAKEGLSDKEKAGQETRSQKFEIKNGARFVIQGNVPFGSGQSSSAAYLVAMTLAANDVFGWNIPVDKEHIPLLADLARSGEHKNYTPFIKKGSCGLLDQTTNLAAALGMAVVLDHSNYEKFEFIDLSVFDRLRYDISVLLSRLSRSLGMTDYPVRVEEFKAIRGWLAEHYPNLKLPDQTGWIRANKEKLCGELERDGRENLSKRLRYVIEEEDRTDQLIEAIKRLNDKPVEDDMALVLRLINESGVGMSMEGPMEISGTCKVPAQAQPIRALDLLRNIVLKEALVSARRQPEPIPDPLAIGVRMIGGGGSGPLGMVIHKKILQDPHFKSAVQQQWKEQTGLDAVFTVDPPAGPAQVVWQASPATETGPPLAAGKKNILVTGGAGYIGSHAVKMLLDQGYHVTVVDNLSRGNREAVDPRAVFYQEDVGNIERMVEILTDNAIEAVMHFAAFIQVGESVVKPDLYYENNFNQSRRLLEAMRLADVKRIIFSSTAAVYGNPERDLIAEDSPRQPINPYGAAKRLVEDTIMDYARIYDFGYTIFRYFNVGGSGPEGTLGEDHQPETHIIPIILEVVQGKRPFFRIFGNDYKTEDGTNVRDYVHVNDLASAHVLALERTHPGQGGEIFNLGSENGFSNRAVIEAAREVTGHAIPVQVDSRREGDPDSLVASSEKAKNVLGWTPLYEDLRDMIRHAWDWFWRHPNGYRTDKLPVTISAQQAMNYVPKAAGTLLSLGSGVAGRDEAYFAEKRSDLNIQTVSAEDFLEHAPKAAASYGFIYARLPENDFSPEDLSRLLGKLRSALSVGGKIFLSVPKRDPLRLRQAASSAGFAVELIAQHKDPEAGALTTLVASGAGESGLPEASLAKGGAGDDVRSLLNLIRDSAPAPETIEPTSPGEMDTAVHHNLQARLAEAGAARAAAAEELQNFLNVQGATHNLRTRTYNTLFINGIRDVQALREAASTPGALEQMGFRPKSGGYGLIMDALAKSIYNAVASELQGTSLYPEELFETVYRLVLQHHRGLAEALNSLRDLVSLETPVDAITEAIRRVAPSPAIDRLFRTAFFGLGQGAGGTGEPSSIEDQIAAAQEFLEPLLDADKKVLKKTWTEAASKMARAVETLRAEPLNDEADFRRYLAHAARLYSLLMTAEDRQDWALAHGHKVDYDSVFKTRARLARITLKPLRVWRVRIDDPDLKRQAQLLESSLILALPAADSKILKLTNRFNGMLVKADLNDGYAAVRDTTLTSGQRREAFHRIFGGFTKQLEDDGILDLFRLRNKKARDFVDGNFVDFSYASHGVSTDQILQLMDTFEAATRDVYRRLNKEHDDQLRTRYPELREAPIYSWDRGLPSSDASDLLDRALPPEAIGPFVDALFEALGLPMNPAIIIVHDEAKGYVMNPAASVIQPGKRVYLGAAMREGAFYAESRAHEGGHGVHYAGISPDLPDIYQWDSIAFSEAIAFLMQWTVMDSDFLKSRLSGLISTTDIEQAARERHYRSLATLRYALAIAEFEIRLYRMSDEEMTVQAVRRLYEEMLKKYLPSFMSDPEDVGGDWGRLMPQMLGPTAYWANYGFGAFGMAALLQSAKNKFGRIVDPRVGPWLAEQFTQGNSEPWLDRLARLTDRSPEDPIPDAETLAEVFQMDTAPVGDKVSGHDPAVLLPVVLSRHQGDILPADTVEFNVKSGSFKGQGPLVERLQTATENAFRAYSKDHDVTSGMQHLVTILRNMDVDSIEFVIKSDLTTVVKKNGQNQTIRVPEKTVSRMPDGKRKVTVFLDRDELLQDNNPLLFDIAVAKGWANAISRPDKEGYRPSARTLEKISLPEFFNLLILGVGPTAVLSALDTATPAWHPLRDMFRHLVLWAVPGFAGGDQDDARVQEFYSEDKGWYYLQEKAEAFIHPFVREHGRLSELLLPVRRSVPAITVPLVDLDRSVADIGPSIANLPFANAWMSKPTGAAQHALLNLLRQGPRLWGYDRSDWLNDPRARILLMVAEAVGGTLAGALRLAGVPITNTQFEDELWQRWAAQLFDSGYFPEIGATAQRDWPLNLFDPRRDELGTRLANWMKAVKTQIGDTAPGEERRVYAPWIRPKPDRLDILTPLREMDYTELVGAVSDHGPLFLETFDHLVRQELRGIPADDIQTRQTAMGVYQAEFTYAGRRRRVIVDTGLIAALQFPAGPFHSIYIGIPYNDFVPSDEVWQQWTDQLLETGGYLIAPDYFIHNNTHRQTIDGQPAEKGFPRSFREVPMGNAGEMAPSERELLFQAHVEPAAAEEAVVVEAGAGEEVAEPAAADEAVVEQAGAEEEEVVAHEPPMWDEPIDHGINAVDSIRADSFGTDWIGRKLLRLMTRISIVSFTQLSDLSKREFIARADYTTTGMLVRVEDELKARGLQWANSSTGDPAKIYIDAFAAPDGTVDAAATNIMTALEKNRIKTWAALTRHSRKEVLLLPFMGQKRFVRIESALAARGLSLKDDTKGTAALKPLENILAGAGLGGLIGFKLFGHHLSPAGLGLSILLGMVAAYLIHELAHFIAAKLEGQEATWRWLGIDVQEKTLFNTAAGPVAGGLSGILFVIIGTLFANPPLQVIGLTMVVINSLSAFLRTRHSDAEILLPAMQNFLKAA